MILYNTAARLYISTTINERTLTDDPVWGRIHITP